MTGGKLDDEFATAVGSALARIARISSTPSWIVTLVNDLGNVVLAASNRGLAVRVGDVLSPGVHSDPRLSASMLISSPIAGTGVSSIGDVIVIDGQPERHSQDLALCELLADTVSSLWKSQHHQAAAERTSARLEAQVDHQTGVANRRSWDLYLPEEERRCSLMGTPTFVVLVQLDQLRTVNEVDGHQAGDQQIVTAAEVVRRIAGDRWFVARPLGDRFALVVQPLHDTSIESIEAALTEQLFAAGVSATVVSVQRNGIDGLQAAYEQAERSIQAVQVLQSATYTGPAPKAELRDALERGAIRAYFQPIVDLRTGDVVALEALARWHDADGVREPAEFLPRLAEAGLLGELFERILDDGLGRLVEFRHQVPNLLLAVNVEFDSVPAGGLLACIQERMADHNLSPGVLSLELSERSTFELPKDVRSELVAVAGIGVNLMLDDFGSGFASMETLTSLPISGVKLDRRFTGQVASGDREHAVLKAMISMAVEAGLTVIAEGIETQVQCDRLVRLGCRMGQGYLFALPQPAESVSAVLSAPLVSAW